MTAYSPDPRDLAGRVPRPDDPVAELVRRARYSRWDGTQRLPDLDADEILKALSDDVMAEGDLAEALRRLMERGWRSGDPTRPDMPGLQDLMERLARRREELRERYDLGDVLGDIRRELDEIVADERAGRRAPPGAVTPPTRPTRTPPERHATSPPAASTGWTRCRPTSATGSASLREYDFLEPDARQRFDELVERLGKQVLDQFVQGMSDAIRSMTPEDLAANREMVRDLNDLIRQRIGGRRPRRRASSSPSTAGSSRAPGPSTTSSTSWPSGWPRCSR